MSDSHFLDTKDFRVQGWEFLESHLPSPRSSQLNPGLLKMSNFKPKGDLVSGPPALQPDPTRILVGQHSVSLIPLTEYHIPCLYESLCGLGNDQLYTYLPAGPFHTLDAFSAHVESLLTSPIFFPYTIMSTSRSTSPEPQPTETPVGIILPFVIAVPNCAHEK